MRWRIACLPLSLLLAGCYGPYTDPLVSRAQSLCVRLPIPKKTRAPPSPPALGDPALPCDTAGLADRVTALQKKGKLNRSLRQIESFAARCPPSPALRSLHEATVSALTSDEPAEKLIVDGLRAKDRGLLSRGQILIDRGLFALERETGRKATADVHPLGAVAGVFLRMSGPSFSYDGAVFAAGHGPHVSVYSTRTGSERMRLSHPRLSDAEIRATEITPDGQIKAYAKHDSTHLCAVWTLAKGDLVRIDEMAENQWTARVTQLAKRIRRVSTEPPDDVPDARVSFDRKGDLTLSVPDASDEGLRERPEAMLVDHRTGQERSLDTLRADAIREVRLGATVLVTAGDRGASWGWSLMTGRPTGRVFPGTRGRLMEPFVQAISPDGRLVTNRAGASLELWSVTAGRHVSSLTGHQKASQFREEIDSVDFSPDGRLVATGDDTGSLRVFRTSDGQLLRKIDAADDEITAVAWSPDARFVATATGGEAAIRIRDIASGATVSVLPMQSGEIELLKWSGDGRHLVAASFTESAALWNIATCTVTPLDRPKGFMTGIDLAPDGSFVVGSFASAGLYVWDSQGRQRASLPSPEPSSFAEIVLHSVSLSPDGRLLSVGTRSGTLLFRAPELAPLALVAQLTRDEAAYVLELSGEPSKWPLVQGRFDVVGRAAAPSVICRVGPRVLPIEACEERLYEPGLLSRLLGFSAGEEP